MPVQLDYLPQEKFFFFFLSLSMTVCVVVNLPEGDKQIAWQKYWLTTWRPFSHLSLAWLGAILMSFFIAIHSSPFTSPPLWRDLQCYCDKHLSFSISVVSLLSVALAYARSFSFFHLPFFFFFGSFSHSLSSPYPSFYRGVVLSPALFQPSLQNAYDWRFQVRYHCTQDFQKWSFCITVRHRHMFKDIFAEFPSHLIPMDLHACALISWLTRESVECVGVKWRHLWRLNKHCTCHKGRHLGYLTVLLTVYVSIADWASLLKHVEEKAFFIIDTSIFITQ